MFESQLRSAWLSSHAFKPAAVVPFLCAHPTIEQFGGGLNSGTAGLLSFLVEPVSIVPRVAKMPNLRLLYFINGNTAPSMRQTICDSARALLRTRVHGNQNLPSLKLRINDEGWRETSTIPEEYRRLREDFPDQILLTGEDDSVPALFHQCEVVSLICSTFPYRRFGNTRRCA